MRDPISPLFPRLGLEAGKSPNGWPSGFPFQGEATHDSQQGALIGENVTARFIHPRSSTFRCRVAIPCFIIRPE